MGGAKHTKACTCIQLLYVAGQSTSVGFADATGGLNRLRDDFDDVTCAINQRNKV